MGLLEHVTVVWSSMGLVEHVVTVVWSGMGLVEHIVTVWCFPLFSIIEFILCTKCIYILCSLRIYMHFLSCTTINY